MISPRSYWSLRILALKSSGSRLCMSATVASTVTGHLSGPSNSIFFFSSACADKAHAKHRMTARRLVFMRGSLHPDDGIEHDYAESDKEEGDCPYGTVP